MKRHDWYYKQQVTQSELDELETYAEAAMRDMALDLYGPGIVGGWAVQQHAPANLSVDVAPGKGWDFNGLRVATSTTQVVDCSKDKNGVSTAVSTSGREKWISILAYFVRVPSDPRTDGSGGMVYFRQLEGCEFRVIQGAESAAPAARPAKPVDGGLLLADVKLSYGTTAIMNAMIDASRRDAMVPHTASDIKVTDEGDRFSGTDVEAVLAELDVAVDAHAALTTGAHGGVAPASHVGAAGAAHGVATMSTAGFMAAADKTKLNGIETGATADMTASEILTALKTVDGAGSGLDADLLQGTGLAAIPRRHLYVGDETVKSVKGTTATSVKSHRVLQCSSHGLRVTRILIVAELMRQTSGTGYMDVYVDGVLAFTLSTTSASYALVKGSTDLSFSDDTVHTVDVRLRHSSSSYYTYNRLYECYVEVS